LLALDEVTAPVNRASARRADLADPQLDPVEVTFRGCSLVADPSREEFVAASLPALPSRTADVDGVLLVPGTRRSSAIVSTSAADGPAQRLMI
jgi:hypothetical protein